MTIKSCDVFAGDCYYSIVQVRSYGKEQDQKHSLNLLIVPFSCLQLGFSYLYAPRYALMYQWKAHCSCKQDL